MAQMLNESQALLEHYKNRLALCERVYATRQNGARLDAEKKMMVAQCLSNVSKYLNENWAGASIVQPANMSDFKRICLDVTTITTPNLICNDILMTYTLKASHAYMIYMEYSLGQAKGEIQGNEVIQNPFFYSPMTEARMNYTGNKVAEVVTDTTADYVFNWGPAVPAGWRDIDHTDLHVAGPEYFDTTDNTWKAFTAAQLNTNAAGQIVGIKTAALSANLKVRYTADMETVPQAKLPTIKAEMKGITLSVKPRRIAVAYNQMAAFEAKQDYGLNFEDTITKQAAAELEYETDSEAVFMIKEAADAECTAASGRLITWVDEVLDTISYSQKAESFTKALEEAKMAFYMANNRFLPSFMLVSPKMMTILPFVKGWSGKAGNIANGPYVAGTIDNLKVIVHPALGQDVASGKVCYFGLVGSDGRSATGVYAPYMPLVQTPAITTADGLTSQGWYSMYDMRILNPRLLAKIVVEDGDGAAAVHVATAVKVDSSTTDPVYTKAVAA